MNSPLSDYDQSHFFGKKYLILTTHSILGGKNRTLLIAYLLASLMSFGFAGLFYFKSKKDPNFDVLKEE